MNEYRTRYNNNQKRRKLAKFHSVYYEGNPNNWKVSRLPNWMNFYGNSLDMELKGDLPTYYRKFKQGTIVMIDYGVPIGNELGGKHFGVVIANNDSKYKRMITVVPLSSKYHRDYVNLGYDLMNGILELLNKRHVELSQEITKAQNRVSNFVQENPPNHFQYTDEEIEYLEKNNISTDLINKSDLTIKIGDENQKDVDILTKLIHQIKKLDSWESRKNIYAFVSWADTVLNFHIDILKKIKKIKGKLIQLDELQKKLEKYNKQSFAIVSQIKTVSKLKVTKLTHYTISGNTRLSDNALSKIQQELIKIIE